VSQSKSYLAYILALSMVVPAYCSESGKPEDKASGDTPVETPKLGYTLTLHAVHEAPVLPEFPRAEISQALMLFIEKFTLPIDEKLSVRVATVLEKLPEGQAEESVRKLMSLKGALPNTLNLLEKLPAELAPQTLELLVQQDQCASLLIRTISQLYPKQLVTTVKRLLSWPEGRIKETLVAARDLVHKHGPSPADAQSKQLLIDVSLMLMKPLDARGHERAKALLQFESNMFFCMLDISRKLLPKGAYQDRMIDILSQLNKGGRKIEASWRLKKPTPLEGQDENVTSATPESADFLALQGFYTELCGASLQHIDTCFKIASPIMDKISATHHQAGALKLALLTQWLSFGEARMDKLLLTLEALLKRNPHALAHVLGVMTVLKGFPLEKFDRLADKLVYFCWGEFGEIIQRLAEVPEKRARAILKRTYDFCEKRHVPLGYPEQLIRAVIALPEGRESAVLLATDSLFTAIEKVERRLEVLFASKYLSVVYALGKLPVKWFDGITQATTEIMKMTAKGLIDPEAGPVDSDDLSTRFNPAIVIQNLKGSKLSGLDEALKVSAKFFENNKPSDKFYAKIIRGLSWIAPEKMEDVLRAFEKIYREYSIEKLSRVIISNLDHLPRERRDELGPVVHRIMTADEDLSKQQKEAIICSIVFVPADQFDDFVTESIESFAEEGSSEDEDDDDRPEEFIANLMRHALAMGEAGGDHFRILLQHWKHILEDEDANKASLLCELITGYHMEMGLHEEHEVVQMAIRVQSVLDKEDEASPYVIYERLKQKRRDPINWQALKPIKGGVEGLYVSLNHQGLAKFGSSIRMDLTSVPKVTATDFVAMLNRLKLILAADLGRTVTQELRQMLVVDLDDAALSKAPLLLQAALMMRDSKEVELISRHEAGIVEEEGSDDAAAVQRLIAETVDDVLQRLGKSFIGVLDLAKEPKSHMCTLMNASVESIEASKLKCVVNYLIHLTDEREKTQRMCQFFAGVRNCGMGQNTAIQDYYVRLPDDYRIRAQGGVFDRNPMELPAMKALYHVLQSVISSQFSPESLFMKKICGIQAHEEIMQAAHQINYMKGLIGDKVGLLEGARFDINAQYIYENILNIPLQDMMQMFYEHVELGSVVQLIKSSLDRLLLAEMKSDERPIYKAMIKIHNSYANKDSFDTWVDYKLLDDEETVVLEGMTTRGVMRLMQHGGILNEVDAPLPW
jgi:hypothetical protein